MLASAVRICAAAESIWARAASTWAVVTSNCALAESYSGRVKLWLSIRVLARRKSASALMRDACACASCAWAERLRLTGAVELALGLGGCIPIIVLADLRQDGPAGHDIAGFQAARPNPVKPGDNSRNPEREADLPAGHDRCRITPAGSWLKHIDLR